MRMCGEKGLEAPHLQPDRMRAHAVTAAAQEYIISRRLFEGLPADEKKYWHSHHYEARLEPKLPGCCRGNVAP